MTSSQRLVSTRNDVGFSRQDQPVQALVVQQSKIGKSRRVPLNAIAMEVLTELQPKSSERLFDFGTQVTKTFAKAAEKAGLEGVTLHTCLATRSEADSPLAGPTSSQSKPWLDTPRS